MYRKLVTLEEYCNERIDLDSFCQKYVTYTIIRKTRYYHNDLRYKNIIINPDTKRLYLIDFEFTSQEYKDLDDENIVKNLNKRKKRTKSK